MRILLSSNHRYPASARTGSGRTPAEFPSRSGFIIHDLIAKGLAEMGHQVFYLLPQGSDAPLPPGLTLLREPIFDVDILHTMTFRDHDLVRDFERAGIPWVATCHLDPTVPGRTIPGPIEDNWIFVSRTLAHALGRKRWVLNGIDPAEYLFSEEKDGYFLFMASLDWSHHKGLDIALHLAARHHLRLVVAGTGKTSEVIEHVAASCRAAGAEFVGDVRGHEKARLLASARGLLFPTQINEAFGLVMAEAMMSGTPVIASANGSCPEIVSQDVGFICRSQQDYSEAVLRVAEISPQGCRKRAMAEFHYRRMAADYLREYQAEIAAAASGAPSRTPAPVRVAGGQA